MYEEEVTQELESVVYTRVAQPMYRDMIPSVDDEIRAARDAIARLKRERPATKQEYLDQLAGLNNDLAELLTENERIRKHNDAVQESGNVAYIASLADARNDPQNQWAAIRIVRDRRLAECDWTQVLDVPLSDDQKAAWRAYRTALRNLPQAVSSPDAVVWPEPPR